MIFSCSFVLIPIRFIRILLSSNARSGNLNNLKVGPYCTLYPGSALIFLSDPRRINAFVFYPPMKISIVSICNFNERDYLQFPVHLLLVFSVLMKIVKNSEARGLTRGYKEMQKINMKEYKFTPMSKIFNCTFFK